MPNTNPSYQDERINFKGSEPAVGLLGLATVPLSWSMSKAIDDAWDAHKSYQKATQNLDSINEKYVPLAKQIRQDKINEARWNKFSDLRSRRTDRIFNLTQSGRLGLASKQLDRLNKLHESMTTKYGPEYNVYADDRRLTATRYQRELKENHRAIMDSLQRRRGALRKLGLGLGATAGLGALAYAFRPKEKTAAVNYDPETRMIDYDVNLDPREWYGKGAVVAGAAALGNVRRAYGTHNKMNELKGDFMKSISKSKDLNRQYMDFKLNDAKLEQLDRVEDRIWHRWKTDNATLTDQGRFIKSEFWKQNYLKNHPEADVMFPGKLKGFSLQERTTRKALHNTLKIGKKRLKKSLGFAGAAGLGALALGYGALRPLENTKTASETPVDRAESVRNGLAVGGVLGLGAGAGAHIAQRRMDAKRLETALGDQARARALAANARESFMTAAKYGDSIEKHVLGRALHKSYAEARQASRAVDAARNALARPFYKRPAAMIPAALGATALVGAGLLNNDLTAYKSNQDR